MKTRNPAEMTFAELHDFLTSSVMMSESTDIAHVICDVANDLYDAIHPGRPEKDRLPHEQPHKEPK